MIKKIFDKYFVKSFSKHWNGIKCLITEKFVTKEVFEERINKVTDIMFSIASTLKANHKSVAKSLSKEDHYVYAEKLVEELSKIQDNELKKVVEESTKLATKISKAEPRKIVTIKKVGTKKK